jgi:hypothetical protein
MDFRDGIITLKPGEICPVADCLFKEDVEGVCAGKKIERDNVFVCDIAKLESEISKRF